MERKDGCCLAPRYGGAAGRGQAWQMGNILLKFRPIAPKPAAMAPAPVPSAPVTPAVGAGKRKRKEVVASSGGKRGRKPNKAAAAVVGAAPAATEKVDVVDKDKPLSSSPSSSSSGMTSVDSSTPPDTPLMHAPSPAEKEGVSVAAQLKPLRPVVASCAVTVDSVTATWRDAAEAPSAAGHDDAPAFVSDQWGRVTWMNLAFSRAVSSGGGSGHAATAPSASVSGAGVVLAAKEGAAVPAWGSCAGFTCRVRVTYAACPRRGSLVAPCDVWRLDAAGGYLWRLDLQATLTLSLGGLL